MSAREVARARCRHAAWLAALMVACAGQRSSAPVTAFVGERLWDGTGRATVEDAALLVEGGRIVAVGSRDMVTIPDGATVVDLAGTTVIPGLINAHGHVGDTRGLEPGHYSRANVLVQLGVYARYGITTVYSLGEDQAAGVVVRDEQDTSSLERARLYVAGPVVVGDTPAAARKMVDDNVRMGVDVIKVRVDDNLGTTKKMPPEVYRAVAEQARRQGKRFVAHVFYLADAKGVLRAGADVIAHSVRDRDADQELLSLMKRGDACYIPTLMREVSTFVYESRPTFFDDLLFRREADSAVVATLASAAYEQRVRRDPAAQAYKRALVVAKRNLKRVSDAGIRVAMGTDTGPPGRFQGYFEHLELEQMVDAGLTPEQALLAATREAAACSRLSSVGTLEPGKWADFVALAADPLSDIRNTRAIASVWIAGNRVPPKAGS